MTGSHLPAPPQEWLTADPFEDDDDLPEGTYTFKGEDPTTWAPADQEAPSAVEAWLDLYADAVIEFSGTQLDRSEVRDGLRLDVSIDGSPRELRAIRSENDWSAVVLWKDVNIPLWMEEQALLESQRIRFGSPPADTSDLPEADEEENEDYEDVDAYRYVPLDGRAPELARMLVDRYVVLFLRFGGFPASRADEAARTLELDVTVDAPSPLLRCTSRFTGETTWLYDWDGSEVEALTWVEQLAFQHGDWCDRDRKIAGPLEWDE